MERFTQAGVSAESVTCVRDTFFFRSDHLSSEEFIEVFRRFYGPTMNAFGAAEKSGRADELQQQLVAEAKKHNRRTNGGMEIPATFLRVTVQR